MFKTLPTFFGPLVSIETDIKIGQQILQQGHWEFQDVLQILWFYEKYFSKRQGHMLDIGCNIGSWTLPLAQRYPENKIIAFDCQAEIVSCVEQTIKLNRLNNAQTQHCAVSDLCTRTCYNKIDYKCEANFGAYEFERPYANSDFNGMTTPDIDTISVLTVDSLNLDQVVFMKLDIEGMEYKALKGAINTITACQPFVTFEHHKTDRVGVENLLENLGYRILSETIGQMSMAVPDSN